MPANRHGRLLPILLCCTALVLPAHAFAQALPTGGNVAAGSASIGKPVNGGMTVKQTSQRAVVNWQGFNVGAGNSVTFNQPNANAATLNRVTGTGGSSVAGNINANGKVYLVNPNGIQITPTGNVDAKGGFIASTLGVSNRDFMAGKDNFTGNGASKGVTNQGTITTGQGGTVALIGGSVANEGTITAPMGKVALGAGEAATLDINGDGFLQVAVPSGATDANGQPLVSNSGRIDAAGGTVELKAAAVRDAMRQAVNMSGTIEARSVSGRNGQVVLGDGSGTTLVSGKVDVSGPVQGGRIDVAGAQVELRGANLDASGGAQGGLVRVGGAFQGGRAQDPSSAQAQKYVTRFGSTPAIASADSTSVDAASTINVAATGAHGTGGTAIVWSNLSTVELGIIDARGATAGGAVEVSSHNAVQSIALGNILTGTGGSLLLDPKNIVIEDDSCVDSVDPSCVNTIAFDTTQNYAFADSIGGTLTLNTQDVMNVLSGGTDLILQASNDITWTSNGAAATSATGIGHLTLDAGRSVIFNVKYELDFLEGTVTIIANDTHAAGVVDGDRDPGAASVSLIANPGNGSGLTAMINGGYDNTPAAQSSFLSVSLLDGAGNTNHDVGSLAISQASFSDVTLSAVPAAQIQFYNQIFDVRNLTVTGNIQATSTGTLGLYGDNIATWTNLFTGTITTTRDTVPFSLGSANGSQHYDGRLTTTDAVRLDVDPGAYSAVYGEALPTVAGNPIVSIDPSSTLQSYAAGDSASVVRIGSGYSFNWNASAGSAVGNYTGSLSGGGSLIRGSAHGGYLVDTSQVFYAPINLTITPRPVVATAFNTGGYTYGQPPGTMAATLAQSDGSTPTGIISGDVVAPVISFSGVSGSQSMLDVSAMTGNAGDYGFDVHAPAGSHTYTVTSLSGASAGNYVIDSVNSLLSASSSISPALLIPTLSAGSYAYGTPDPLVTLSGVVGGDTVAPVATITGIAGSRTMTDAGGGNYAFDMHVDAGSRTYTLTGIGGADGGNYTLDMSGTLSAALNIAPKTLTYASSGGNTNSTYGTLANLDLALSGVLTGDDVSAAAIVTGTNGVVTLGTRTPAGSYTISPNGLTGAQAADYTITSASNFGLTIAPLAISYNAPSGTVNYGTAFGGALSLPGILSGDDVSASLGIRKSGVTSVYDNHADAGTYQTLPTAITGAQAGNYTITGTPGSLTINAISLDYLLHDGTATYGSGAVPLADLSGILFGDDVSAAVSVSAPGGYGTGTGVGNYGASITGLTGAKAGDYVLGTGTGASTLTVSPKALSLDSGNTSGTTTTYGSGTAQSFVTLLGLVSTADAQAIHPVLSITDAQGNVISTSTDITNLGETIASLTGRPDAGLYTVSVTGVSSNDGSHPASNYSFTPVSAPSITVNRAVLTAGITDPAYVATYGAAFAIGQGISFSNFASGEGATGRYTMVDAQGHPVTLGAASAYSLGSGSAVLAGTNAGTYTVTVDTTSFDGLGGAKISNYIIANAPSTTLTINPKALNWTVNNTTSTYGTLAAPVTSLRNIFGSDDVYINNFSLTDTNSSPVAFSDRVMGSSTYTIGAAGLGGAKAANYTLATTGINVAGTLTVNPKLVTWSVADTTDVYGSANALRDMGAVTLTGVLSGDTLGAVAGFYGPNGPGNPQPTIDQTTAAGTYSMYVTAISGNNAALHNYTIGNVIENHVGTFTVTPEPITVQIADASVTWGAGAATFAGTSMGVQSGVLYNGDQLHIDGYSFDLGLGDVGAYAINGGAHVSSNYAVTVLPGTLTITPLALTYNVGNLTWVYGDLTNSQIAAAAPTVSFARASDGADFTAVIGTGYSTAVSAFGTLVTLTQYSNVLDYTTSVTSLASPNFTLSGGHAGTISITPRTLTLHGGTSIYGDRPVLTLSNILAGDDVSLFDVTLAGTTGNIYDISQIWNADGSLRTLGAPPVDSYGVTAASLAGLRSFNYVLAPATTVSYAITPRPITIASMAPVSITYGDNPDSGYAIGTAFDVADGPYNTITQYAFNRLVTFNNLVPGDQSTMLVPYMKGTFSTRNNVGTYTWTVDASQGLAATGSITNIAGAKQTPVYVPTPVTCNKVGCPNLNYVLTGTASATVTINPKLITYSTIDTAVGAIYGSSPSLSVMVTGVLPGDEASLTPLVATYNPYSPTPDLTYYNQTVRLTYTATGKYDAASGSVIYQGQITNAPFGSSILATYGVTGPGASNYRYDLLDYTNPANFTATMNIAPKPITYATTGGTGYTGIGGIAGSLDDLGNYTLTGLVPGDTLGTTIYLVKDGGSTNTGGYFIDGAGNLPAGLYDVVVSSLTGALADHYVLDTTHSMQGVLTMVDLRTSLNGLELLGNQSAGTTALSAAQAARDAAGSVAQARDLTTSIDLTGVASGIMGGSLSDAEAALQATRDASNGQSDPNLAGLQTALLSNNGASALSVVVNKPVTLPAPAQPQADPNSTNMQTGTDTSHSETTTTNLDCNAASCILTSSIGQTATGDVNAQACAAGIVCISGGASYEATNQVTATSVTARDTVGASTGVNDQGNTAIGTFGQHVDASVQVGVDVEGGAVIRSTGVSVMEGASAGAGAGVEGGASYSGEYGGVDTSAGISAGKLGGAVGASGSYENGTLTIGFSGELDLEIGLDINFQVSLNIDAIGDAFNGTNTTYRVFTNESAAYQRTVDATYFIQQAQVLQASERDFVSAVLAGKYNDDPNAIARWSTYYKNQETQLQSEGQAQNFSIYAAQGGGLAFTDSNPPATTQVTQHNDGILDVWKSAF